MPQDAPAPASGATLRERAEAAFREKAAGAAQNTAARSPQATRELLHELQVHQIELEMQNEELRRAQAELEEARSRYFDLYDLAPVGYCILSASGLILEANLTAAALLGLARGALAKRPLSQYILKDDQDLYYLQCKRLTETGAAQAFELRMVKHDGTNFWAHLIASSVENHHGSRNMRLVLTDVSEQRRFADAIKLSEERMRAIFQTEPECVKIIDSEGKLVEMNAAGLAILEVDTLDEARKQGLEYYVLPEYWEAFKALHARVMRGESGVLEFEIEGMKGTRRRLDTHAAPLRNVAGEVEQMLSITRDITERRRAEDERARAEIQLRESQKMEALGTLAGGVAHDFNNMLAMIVGNLELARQDVGPGHPALESLEEIAKASRRAKDLVQQILAFGRRQKVERKPTSLSLVVLESARLLRAGLPAKVALKVDCKPDAPAVLADATQINQLMLNLCGNALQAVQDRERPGLIEVSVQAHTQSEAGGNLPPGRYACLTVRDNGSGMDDATRSRIFEPFFTTKGVGKGTGLGLAVAHSIVREHEARIAVESAPGEGSTFRIYFPAIDVPAAAGHAAPAPSPAPVQGKGKHVLFVDDEEGLVHLMRRLLTRQGFRFSGYDDPREALAAVRADPGQFDLVVTDYNMPHLSGLELAQALKAIRADLPVVLASGYITEELRAKAPDAGIRELIYKPNTVDELCEAVARYANAQGGNISPS